jgi:hypothetical protein
MFSKILSNQFSERAKNFIILSNLYPNRLIVKFLISNLLFNFSNKRFLQYILSEYLIEV